MKHLTEICVSVENAEEEILKLLKVVKPTWNRDEIRLKKLSGGFSCLMYTCFHKEDKEDGVTVRARTNTFQDFPHVRGSAFEAKIMQVMHEKGLFTEVLATFKNGYCYTYILGEPLYTYTMFEIALDEETIRLMASKLAEIHCTKVEGCDYTQTVYFKNLFTILDEKYPDVSEQNPLEAPPRDELTNELKILEARAIEEGSPLVLCHGDPHPGNIVYDKEKGIVTYVDWELTHVGYQAFDVAYALQVLQVIGIDPRIKMNVPEDFDRMYMRFYLEKWFDLQDKKLPVTKEDVDKLESQIGVFRMTSQLFWIIIMVAQFAVGMPDHINVEEFQETLENAQKSREDSSATASDNPFEGIDLITAPDDYNKKMLKIMYDAYLKMKDELLTPSSNK